MFRTVAASLLASFPGFTLTHTQTKAAKPGNEAAEATNHTFVSFPEDDLESVNEST